MSEKPKNKERKWFNFGKTEDKIRRFIDTSDKITDEERDQITEELEGKDMKELFRFIALSISWSSIALTMDLTINSIVGTTALAQGALRYSHLLPTLIFSSVDYAIKYSVYRRYYGHLLTRWQTAKSSLPTLGPLFLINELFRDSPVFARALKLYISQSSPLKRLTSSISNRVKSLLGQKKTAATTTYAT